jgi:replicative superfamily II helicase
MVEALSDDLRDAARNVVGEHLLSDIGFEPSPRPAQFDFTANGFALAAHNLLDQSERSDDLREAAEMAFEAFRASKMPGNSEAAVLHVLHTACYGVLGDRTPDVRRYLANHSIPDPPGDDWDWGSRVRNGVYRLWLLLVRKDGWSDLDAVQNEVVALRQAQQRAESEFLQRSDRPRVDAWHLMASYHLSKAAELLAIYTSQGTVGGGFNIREQLEAQFDRSIIACERAELVNFHGTVKLLAATAERMVANSIWWVARSANRRLIQFVENMADRSRDRPIFEMLPPQRMTLRDQGLLNSGARSVVVSLPTSGGKTFIAQFRILQALSQFEAERGWVAYIAPTRALVNQVCAKLRRDFAPLGIVVERVSPALDIDGVEAELLVDRDPNSAFRVLVGTPEKIDLLLRGGWESKIGRPLTLVVVDEAHNLSNDARGLRLELMLATINRECRFSQFLLLTPFIDNRAEVARWLSPDSHADMTVEFSWRPNDRAIVLAQPAKGGKVGDFEISLKTLHTTRSTIEINDTIPLCSGRELGLTWSKVGGSLSNIAAVTASCLNRRGPVIAVAQKVKDAWSLARTIANDPKLEEKLAERGSSTANVDFVADFIAEEFGVHFELGELLKKRIGLHHSGLSDDTKVLMEWLMENGELDTLVATTTIAQGLNFPVTAVVMASHQYVYGADMPAEDFWNLAGRAGRADQAGTGVVAMAATDADRVQVLSDYVGRSVSQLNSTLVGMVRAALDTGSRLELHALYYKKEWSSFLQYLAHSYRQIGDHAEFANQIEQVLRGSFGFQKLRREDQSSANRLVAAVNEYAAVIRNQPLSLVDTTGFSWESVSQALAGARAAGIRASSWDASSLFSDNDTTLKNAFGVLLQVPELRKELAEVTGGGRGDGNLLAQIVKDWVNGASLADLAREHFSKPGDSETTAMSKACRLIYGRLTSTASWGLSAIQSLTIGNAIDSMTAEEQRTFRNLPSRIYYGVNSDAAIDLRLMGVPRNAAQPLSDYLASRTVARGLTSMRGALTNLTADDWRAAIGRAGPTYHRAWRILEGLA